MNDSSPVLPAAHRRARRSYSARQAMLCAAVTAAWLMFADAFLWPVFASANFPDLHALSWREFAWRFVWYTPFWFVVVWMFWTRGYEKGRREYRATQG